MTLLLAALALAGFHPFGNGQTFSSRYRIPAWEIRVSRDKFTGERHCLLYQGSRARRDVSYAHGAVAFHFARRLNTTDASVKLDGGAAQPWADYYPQLVNTGAQLEGRSLDNPTGGKVMLPLSVLKGVHVVNIRPTPRSRPKLFSVDGLGDALASARNLGCDASTGFGS